MKNIRITKKYRTLNAITSVIEEMVLGENDCCPSIGRVVDSLVDDNLSENADPAIRTLVMDEIANDVTRYFPEACAQVSQENEDIPYHFVNNAFYKAVKSNTYRTPETPEAARKFVAMFANGRGNKTAGVRFLNDYKEAAGDHLYAVYNERLCEVSAAAAKASANKFINAWKKGVLTVTDVKKLPDTVKNLLPADIRNAA